MEKKRSIIALKALSVAYSYDVEQLRGSANNFLRFFHLFLVADILVVDECRLGSNWAKQTVQLRNYLALLQPGLKKIGTRDTSSHHLVTDRLSAFSLKFPIYCSPSPVSYTTNYMMYRW